MRLPGAAEAAVTESGTPLDDATGVLVTRQDGEDVVAEVGSGDYTFEYDADTPDASSGEDAPGPDATVGEMLAHPETRSVLREALPEVTASLWLSRAMGFSLDRLPRVVPLDVPDATLRSVRRQLRQATR